MGFKSSVTSKEKVASDQSTLSTKHNRHIHIATVLWDLLLPQSCIRQGHLAEDGRKQCLLPSSKLIAFLKLVFLPRIICFNYPISLSQRFRKSLVRRIEKQMSFTWHNKKKTNQPLGPHDFSKRLQSTPNSANFLGNFTVCRNGTRGLKMSFKQLLLKSNQGLPIFSSA